MPSFSSQRPLYEVKANLFKGLAHPVRIRILELLSDTPEVPVSVLVQETGLEASHLSQHLAVLRRHRLVESERRGSSVYYRLAHPQVAQMLAVARELLHATLAVDGGLLTEARTLPSPPGNGEAGDARAHPAGRAGPAGSDGGAAGVNQGQGA